MTPKPTWASPTWLHGVTCMLAVPLGGTLLGLRLTTTAVRAPPLTVTFSVHCCTPGSPSAAVHESSPPWVTLTTSTWVFGPDSTGLPASASACSYLSYWPW